MNKQYNKNVKLWKKAYTELLKVCNKYPGFSSSFGFNDIDKVKVSAINHLQLIEFYEKYGIKISHDFGAGVIDYFTLGNNIIIEYYKDAETCKKEHRGRYISCPDDGRQPEDGWYFILFFSTGAYIFGDDYEYQVDLFNLFLNELKAYKPDYLDSANKKFYWKIENAKPIFDDFYDILKKYREKNKSELKHREVEKLKKKLKEAEDEANN